MHRDRGPAAPVVLGLLAGFIACGGPEAPALSVSFSRAALEQQTASVAISFFAGDETCGSIRGARPRPDALLGPFEASFEGTAAGEPKTFTRTDIPAGTYVVLVDALDAAGARIGAGCAQGQRIHDRQVSRIRVVLEPLP